MVVEQGIAVHIKGIAVYIKGITICTKGITLCTKGITVRMTEIASVSRPRDDRLRAARRSSQGRETIVSGARDAGRIRHKNDFCLLPFRVGFWIYSFSLHINSVIISQSVLRFRQEKRKISCSGFNGMSDLSTFAASKRRLSSCFC